MGDSAGCGGTQLSSQHWEMDSGQKGGEPSGRCCEFKASLGYAVRPCLSDSRLKTEMKKTTNPALDYVTSSLRREILLNQP